MELLLHGTVPLCMFPIRGPALIIHCQSDTPTQSDTPGTPSNIDTVDGFAALSLGVSLVQVYIVQRVFRIIPLGDDGTIRYNN